MLKRFVKLFGGDPNKREIEKFSGIVDEINALEPEFEKLTREQLAAKTGEFKNRLTGGETLDDILVEAFATVREASKRTIGLRHFDVQLIGGIALHQGTIAEMRTGEGKTLVATLPLYLNALTSKGTHLVTVNDYLARRDARWMSPIFSLLGLTVGVLQMASRTENGKKAFLVDLERESPHEDQHQLRMVPRREAYQADITYGTNSEFGFDYLRDNMSMQLEERVQRGHYYAIIDEVDNVLVDEARTPLIISGPAQDEAEWYIRMAQVVKSLRPEDYEIEEKDRTVTLTEIGETHVEEILGMALRDPDRPEDVTPEQARLLGYLEQALRAQHLFRRNKDYLVQAGKVVIIDEFTGRLMPGRRWSDGLHQAVEAKEGVKVQSESVTYATITIQNYFRMYEKLSGMTGTAVTEAEEFDEIYSLEVLAIPTNLEYQASRPESNLDIIDAKDEEGYKYTYYAHTDDPHKEAVFYQRQDYPDVVYRTVEVKLRAIAQEIMRYHVLGRPLLIGTTSVELSDLVSNRLRAEPLRRLAQVLLIRDAWLTTNHREEDGRLIEELQYLNQPIENLPISEMRKMARDLNLSFNPEDANNVQRLLYLLGIPEAEPERLVDILKAGISHQVLNARKHTEESQIIAGAGAFGAVTIATNMAGRGVDIKLGGELAEEVLSTVNRVLTRAGYDDPYDMSMEERRQALQKLSPDDYGIYDSEITYYLQYMDDMERVRALGGLHVIGSERHEARRIDNQLRGRAARQGDPGSSRFYLSMEDDLMRLFGGAQADSLMQRLKIDDALPLEVRLVSRIVEQSQTRVEGANFDVRKHLLEYDDVLNTQRQRIYDQRDRIFTKYDLSEDVTEMLRSEVNRRVPEALADEEGPWKLLAWLDQIQPPLSINNFVFPSYSLRLLVEEIIGPTQFDGDGGTVSISKENTRQALINIAERAIKSEEHHLLATVNNLLNITQDRLNTQIDERLEILDIFFDGISMEDETDTRRPAELANELSALIHLPLRLSNEQQRGLRENPDEIYAELRGVVEEFLNNQAITRLVGSIERRLEEPLEFDTNELAGKDWNVIANEILDAIESIYDRRIERYLNEQGLIVREIDNTLSKIDGPVTRPLLIHLLMLLPQGARATFDRKTHRRVWQRTTRLTYVYAAAHNIENREPVEITEEVLEHLENALGTMRQAWGVVELNRLAPDSISEFDDTIRRNLMHNLGEQHYQEIVDQPIPTLSPDDLKELIDELGRRALTIIYRQLLLSVITELWVEYLTQMESLRISIGLEAYAQRDPLVQYKNRAYELFQNLFNDMRTGVVTRMFTFRPRENSSIQMNANRLDDSAIPTDESEAVLEALEIDSKADTGDTQEEVDEKEIETADSNVSTSRKRRRRRR